MGGIVDDVVGASSFGLIETDFAGDEAAAAARRAAGQQVKAGKAALAAGEAARARAQSFFDPFEGVGERGVEASSFLADPQAQFDFLQNNPLFKLALENANEQTQQRASAGRRLSFGDTLQELSNNVLLSASPLIDRQRQDVGNLINFGVGTAGSRANIETGGVASSQGLITDVGAARAGGTIGAANAHTAGTQQLLDLAGGVAGFAAGGFPSFGGGVPINQELANSSGIITPA